MPADPRPWPERVEASRELLVRRGHVDPVVGVDTPGGRYVAGDLDQRWEIGSITKLLTALLLAELARAGVVGLADPIARHLPAATRLAPGVAGITLEQLACHRSGLPRLPPGVLRSSLATGGAADPYAGIDEQRLLASLAVTRVRGTPGRAPVRYSNYGVGLLGFLLGRATGLGYEASLARWVLGPLGMPATSLDDAGLHQGRTRRGPVGPWHLGALAGAGGLRSTARDLLALLAAVRDRTGPLAAAIEETLRPRGGRIGVGLGWFLMGDGELLMHDGGTRGARSEVRLELPTGTAVVVLGDGRRGTARAAALLLNPR